jgi:hypothetical protein
MTLSTGRHVLRGLAFAGVAAAGYAFGITSDRAAAQPTLPGTPAAPAPQPGMLPVGMQPQPAPQPPKPGQPLPEPDRRIVGYIYGNVPVTREELGDFLIARGGYEKLELLVNKRIIEIEAQRRNITVTTVEIKAKLEETLRGLSVDLKDFEDKVLKHYGKSLYEYVEDVIRPEMLMTKMCRDRVKVADEDIQKAFENRFGERRQARIICWGAADAKIALKQWEEARQSPEAFKRIARTQADPNLAAAEGLTKPVGKHLENATDTKLATALYSLKPGEISGVIQLENGAGLMCVMCEGIIPPDANVKLDDKMKAALGNDLFQRKLELEIPKFFHELRKAAQPNLILKGPPSAAEYREGVQNIINQAGGVPPGATPVPGPMRP